MRQTAVLYSSKHRYSQYKMPQSTHHRRVIINTKLCISFTRGRCCSTCTDRGGCGIRSRYHCIDTITTSSHSCFYILGNSETESFIDDRYNFSWITSHVLICASAPM